MQGMIWKISSSAFLHIIDSSIMSPIPLSGFRTIARKNFVPYLPSHTKAEREATEDEIAEHMQALGFEMDYYDEFHNEEYEIFDAVPNNVLYGIDGALYFIDTQIRLKTNDQDEHVSVK